ncbi:MAG: aldo/keto reductase [Bacteroidales bacterium]
MKMNNRRDFIKKSVMGMSAAALMPVTIKNFTENKYSVMPELPSRILGRTGIKTPLISFGTAGINDTGLIKEAYHSGVKVFFSATYYGEGNNERILGEGLRGFQRDSFIVGTAVPADGLNTRSGLFTTPFDTDAYIKKTDACLSRFRMDHVDFFLFPYASKRETVMDDKLLKTMEQLKKQGKTRFLGIASHSGTEEALKAAADSRVYDIAMISYNFKVSDKESLDDVISYAVKAGMGVVAMKTTSGVLNNKSGTSIDTTAALKWVLQNENISSIVSGMTSIEQLQKNLAMLNNLKMTDQEKKELGIAAFENKYGLYCRQCNECLPQCPYNLDIPAIMRSYMYAYGYKNQKQAWYTLIESGLSENVCRNCDECKVKCPSGFDIKGKITDIARLKNVPIEFLVNA